MAQVLEYKRLSAPIHLVIKLEIAPQMLIYKHLGTLLYTIIAPMNVIIKLEIAPQMLVFKYLGTFLCTIIVQVSNGLAQLNRMRASRAISLAGKPSDVHPFLRRDS